ncbi:hypothetical protein [Pseudogracilibacillus auburnensis]|uniref:hypothetical protein n=1 Tax=Pseudogracilibacillus auburnensis TaxID=1494959 RepID=UPI001A957691|nr:hypothetical protein [Pseudogracilibacillus auburnensis]MBO1005779.1 hypothetical protein [Pseudogracilibacillus auburnensis]
MTLLMQASVGKTESCPFPFVIATGDTRSIYRRFYYDTFEFGDEIIDSHDDSNDKVARITNNVLISSGGTSEVSDALRGFIEERTKDHYFLDDFKPIMNEAYKYVRENSDKVINHLLDTDHFYVSLVGFFKNGSPGRLQLALGGEVNSTEVPSGLVAYNLFAPSDDISKRQDELMNFGNSPFLYLLNEGGNDVDVYVQHLLFVHSLIASQEVETISGTCLVHLLQRSDEKIHYEYYEIDLTERIKEIQNM